MKTHAVIAAVALFSSVAPAQVNAPTASFASVDRVESAINELCELQVKIVEILETVKDKESADAQAPALIEAAQALAAQLAAMETLQHQLKGLPNADDKAAFEQCYNNLQVAGMDLQTELRRLAMVNFYDSEVFMNAILSLQQP